MLSVPRYSSTRGTIRDLSFEEALLSGFASDGGLLLPEFIPQVDTITLNEWKHLSYVELSKQIMSLFISTDEIPSKDLNDLLDKAYAGFGHADVTPLVKVGDVYVLELFHGKTLAFKDIALAAVGQFLNYFLSKRHEHMVILVGTSGDTGSAAIESVRGLEWADIIVLFPKGYCNYFQELQMTTVIADNVHVFSVDGSSDDLDVPIRNCFMDEEYVQKYNLCSVNSINWVRVLAQTVHLFYAYFRVCQKIGETVQFFLPTGAMGHVTAGVLARQMGLPIKLVCAVNDNDIVHRTLSKGDFSPVDSVVQTWSTAMDIQVPYNMERVLFLFSDMDAVLTSSLMESLETNKAAKVPEELRCKMTEVISSTSVSCDQTIETIKKCWQQHHYLICPHTAVAMTAAWTESESCGDKHLPFVCVATASPIKFPEAIKAAGIEPLLSDEMTTLKTKAAYCEEMKKGEDWDRILRDKIQSIHHARIH